MAGLGGVVVVARSPTQQLTLTEAYQVIKSKQFVDLTHSFEPGISGGKAFPTKSAKRFTGTNQV